MGINRNKDMSMWCSVHFVPVGTCLDKDCKAKLCDPYDFEDVFKAKKDQVLREDDRHFQAIREIEQKFKDVLVSISVDRKPPVCSTSTK